MIIKRKLFTDYKTLKWAEGLGITTPEEAKAYLDKHPNLSPEKQEAVHKVSRREMKTTNISGHAPSPADPGHGNRKIEMIDPKKPRHPKKGWKLKPKIKGGGLWGLAATLISTGIGIGLQQYQTYKKKKEEEKKKLNQSSSQPEK